MHFTKIHLFLQYYTEIKHCYLQRKKNDHWWLGLDNLIDRVDVPCGLGLSLFYFLSSKLPPSVSGMALSGIFWIETMMGLRNSFLFCSLSVESSWGLQTPGWQDLFIHEGTLKKYLMSTSVLVPVISSGSPGGKASMSIRISVITLEPNSAAIYILVSESALSSCK